MPELRRSGVAVLAGSGLIRLGTQKLNKWNLAPGICYLAPCFVPWAMQFARLNAMLWRRECCMYIADNPFSREFSRTSERKSGVEQEAEGIRAA